MDLAFSPLPKSTLHIQMEENSPLDIQGSLHDQRTKVLPFFLA